MKNLLVAVAGFQGSGKDTVGKYLIEQYGMQKDSFAGPLKDACATIFGWDREMLEGSTPESREWRENVDLWWASRLSIPHFTPRWALQHLGTEVLRLGFHNDIWLLSLENRLLKNQQPIIVTDCRFQNEISLVRRLGGVTIQVERGMRPHWWTFAKEANRTRDPLQIRYLEEDLGIHASEYSWVGTQMDFVVKNDKTLNDLHLQVDNIWKKISCKDT